MHHTYRRITEVMPDGSTVAVLQCPDCGASPIPPQEARSDLYLGGSICRAQRARRKAELKAQGFRTFRERLRVIDPSRCTT